MCYIREKEKCAIKKKKKKKTSRESDLFALKSFSERL